MTTDKRPDEGDGSPDSRVGRPLLALLDALVNDRGRVATAEALGINGRTMASGVGGVPVGGRC